mgnify:CR=1 FL=1
MFYSYFGWEWYVCHFHSYIGDCDTAATRKKDYFRYFEIQNKTGKFRYIYLVKPGVSDERLGMYILNQEKVVETIRKAAI